MSKPELTHSALTAAEFPKGTQQELAVLGRSNSGKSTLINALVRAKVAHTSSTPGRTQRINFFRMDGWYLVDLPGFGYAKVPLDVKEAFGQAVERYLTERQQITGAVLIQDIRRDPGPEEEMIRQWAARRNLLLLVVANKADKLGTTALAERKEALDRAYRDAVYAVSAYRKTGLDPLRQALKGMGLAGI